MNFDDYIYFITASEAQMYVKHKYKRLYSDSEQKYMNKGSTEMLYIMQC